MHVEDSLSLYVDGLLTAPDRRDMEAHIGSCPSCADRLDVVVDARNAIRALPGVGVPDHLFSKLVSVGGQVPASCARIEDRLARLVGGDVDPSEQDQLLTHVGACASCRELHDAITQGLSWARTFPQHDAPASLMARILHQTAPSLNGRVDRGPVDATRVRETRVRETRVRETWVRETWVRETWMDTLGLVARWLMEPRTAMMALTSVLVMGWIFSVAGVRPDVRSLSNPAAIFDSVQSIADEVYDEGIRLYYSVPHRVVGEVQARIEQLREEPL